MKHHRIFPRLRYRADLRTLGLMALGLVLLGGAWSGLLVERLRRPPVSHAR